LDLAGSKQPVVVHYTEHLPPMTEEQWAAERATIIDETPVEEPPAPTK
jgi:hypothetical protein